LIGLQTTSDIVCRECSTELDSKRVQLGLYTCIDCSDTQKYSAHVVYPHKTGAIVQPVQEDTKRNIQRLDRRSSNGGRVAKGIFADNSWDRWLEKYYDNIYNKQTTKKSLKKISQKFSHMKTETLYQTIVKEFIEWGYQRAVDKVNELYSQDKISLIQKGKMIDNLSKLQMMTSKEKKFFKKLENNS
jgi:ribosomal protein L37AE/L43A